MKFIIAKKFLQKFLCRNKIFHAEDFRGVIVMFTIEEIREKVIPIAKKYDVKKISLFGSYARGEADEKSDVDFLFNGGDGKIKSYFNYLDFLFDLEDEFKCHVDAVSEGISDKNFLNEIKNDEVILYER